MAPTKQTNNSFTCNICEENGNVKKLLMCIKCNLYFHPICVEFSTQKFNKLSAKVRASWRCTNCEARDNDQSVESASKIRTPIIDDNTTMENVSMVKQTIDQSLKGFQDVILQAYNNLKTEFGEVIKSLEFISEENNKIRKKLNDMEKDNNEKIESLMKHNKNLMNRIQVLEQRINTRDQDTNCKKVHVVGIQYDASVSNKILAIGKIIGSDIKTTDFDVIPSKSVASGKVKKTTIEFHNKQTKIKFIRSVRMFNKSKNISDKLNGSHVGLEHKNPIYFNEFLTPVNGEIYHAARDKLKKKLILQTWVYNGTIYIKSNKEITHQIHTLEDLEKII